MQRWRCQVGAPLRSEWNGGAGVPLQSCGVSGGEMGWESGWWGDVWVLCPVHLCCPETVSQPAVGRGCHSNPVTLSQSWSFPFPPQDQSESPFHRSPLFISSISWRPTFSSQLFIPALPTTSSSRSCCAGRKSH